MYTFVNFSSQIVTQRGFLVPQTRGLIHQFSVWLGRDLKIRLFIQLSNLFRTIMVIYEYDVMQNCFLDTHENNDNDRIGK
jgi:hypothetical protein